MDIWNPDKFYEENFESITTFIILNEPPYKHIRAPLPLVLSQIIRENLEGFKWHGTVHTPEGYVLLRSEERSDLLVIQARAETEMAETEAPSATDSEGGDSDAPPDGNSAVLPAGGAFVDRADHLKENGWFFRLGQSVTKVGRLFV